MPAGLAVRVTALFLVLICLTTAIACNGGASEADSSALLSKGSLLSRSEREALQREILMNVQGKVFDLKNPLSTTHLLELQYGEDGRIEFAREADDVRAPDQQGVTQAGLAVATYEYTGEQLKKCDGTLTDRELVIRWDALFGNDYVSIAPAPIDYSALTIAIDGQETEDLGYDPATRSRAFKSRIGNDGTTATIWYGGDSEILPLRFTSSDGPEGLVVNLTKTNKETIAPPENLTPPECER